MVFLSGDEPLWMAGGDPLTRLNIFESGFDRAILIPGSVRQTAPATDHVTDEPIEKPTILGDEVAGIDVKPKLLLQRFGESRNQQERGIDLPINKPRYRGGADSGCTGEAANAFEGELVVVSHHVGKPIDGRPEGLG